jgi:uncharacterized protein
MLCPVDGAAMAAHEHGDIHFEACPECHGLWFEREQLTASARAGDFSAPSAYGSGGPAAPRSMGGALRCPRCERRLLTKRLGEVELDACPHCRAVWLDAGEFDAVRSWYAQSPPTPRSKSSRGTLRHAPRKYVVRNGRSFLPDAGDVAEGVVDVVLWDPGFLHVVGEVVVSAGGAVVEVTGQAVAYTAEGIATLIGGIFEGLFEGFFN